MGCSASNAVNASVRGKHCAIGDFSTNFFDYYRLDAKLGQGAFAQVRLVSSLSSGMCAAETQEKCVKILDTRDDGLQRLAAMEVEIWKRVGHHPNILELSDAFIHENICFLVMRKCSCSLYNYMEDMADLNERSFGKLVLQMVSALHHMHTIRVVHRDVKPDNFLVGGMDGNTVQLCDFGLAAILPDHGKLCGIVGTTPFMCPEMFSGEWYDEKADIWSLAVTVYVFLFGDFPYVSKDRTKQGMREAIIQGTPPKFYPVGQRKNSYSSNTLNFVAALLQRDIDARPSAEEALKFPYVTKAMTGRHVKGVASPSLRPMLNSVRRVGAISIYNLSRKTALDDLLSDVQFKHLGIRMPHAWTTKQGSKEEKDVVKLHTSSALSTISESTSCTTAPPDPQSSLECSLTSRHMAL